MLKAFYYKHREWLGPKMPLYFVLRADQALDLVWQNSDPAFARTVLRVHTVPVPSDGDTTWQSKYSNVVADLLRDMSRAMAPSKVKKST